MPSAVECVVRVSNQLGESPVWCDRTDRLYWVDSREPAVYWHDLATGRTQQRTLTEIIGSIGLRETHGLIAALRTGFHLLDPETGAVTPLVDPEPHLNENRFNDGRCDRGGRFWAGTMSDVRRDATGALYCLEPDTTCRRVFGEVIVPNSIAWSPDSRHMYFADTYRSVITQFDFDVHEGHLSAPRVFRDTSRHPGRPDGSAVDETGCLWNAEYGGARIVRYTPSGVIDTVVAMPVTCPTCCVFGGPALDTLFITSARQRLTSGQLAEQPLAGAVFAFVPGVCGVPEGRYDG